MATIPEATHAHAVLVARQAGVIAGLPLAVAMFQKLSPDISIEAHVRDGGAVAAGVHVLTISGPARAVLAGERTALNFVGRLSGIATLTADYVRHTAGTKMRICCTRKTTPGLRALEKYAVRCGGGFNHRFGLDDAILIKDNHIAVAGGVTAGAASARGRMPGIWSRSRSRSIRWRNCAKCSTPDWPTSCCSTIWTSPTLTEAVKLARNGRVVLEASGGVTQDSIAKIAATGVDYASSGALTHSAPNFDVALDIDA